MTPKRFFLLFAVLSLFVWQIEWQLSPLHRVYAWGSLKFAVSKQSPQTVIDNLKTLSATPNAQLPDVIATARSYQLSIATPEVSATMVTLPYAHNVTKTDSFLPTSITYETPGAAGQQRQYTRKLIIEGTEVTQYTELGEVYEVPHDQSTVTGTRTIEETTADVMNAWKSLTTAINTKDEITLRTLLASSDMGSSAKILSLRDVTYRIEATTTPSVSLVKAEPDLIVIGSISLQQPGCTTAGSIPLYYEYYQETQKLRFKNVYAALAGMCAKALPAGAELACTNCWLAPVSKQYPLASTYAPTVVNTGLNGGGQLTQDTVDALAKMFADMNAKGMKPKISSSYRSYSVQVGLFNYYVASEEKYGLSHEQAIEKANTYSAKPGYSEHQLGTTVDIVGCPTTCGFYAAENIPVYDYLNANAHKFGFVISYPNGSQAYTGYVYEPWHIRYIGVDRATDLYNKGYLWNKGYYLYHYLIERGEY